MGEPGFFACEEINAAKVKVPPPEIPALSDDAPLQRFGGPGAEAYRRIIEAKDAQHARDAERIAHLESVLNRIADAAPQTIQGCRHDDGERDCATCDKLITWAAEAVG